LALLTALLIWNTFPAALSSGFGKIGVLTLLISSIYLI